MKTILNSVLINLTLLGLIFGSALQPKSDERQELISANSAKKETSETNHDKRLVGMDPESLEDSSPNPMSFFKSMMNMFSGGATTTMMNDQSQPLMDMINRQMQMVMSMVSDMMGRISNRGPMKWDIVKNEDANDVEIINLPPYAYRRDKRQTEGKKEQIDPRDEIRHSFEKYMQKTREALRKSWIQLNDMLRDSRNQLNSTIEKAIDKIRKQTSTKKDLPTSS